jgi:N-acetylmuramoyl-L-alanine amidase
MDSNGMCIHPRIAGARRLAIERAPLTEIRGIIVRAKKVPDRFPSNEDSIGIELVGEALPRGSSVREDQKKYESVSDAQNASLKWLVKELAATLHVPLQPASAARGRNSSRPSVP